MSESIAHQENRLARVRGIWLRKMGAWLGLPLVLVSVCGAASPFTNVAVGERLPEADLTKLEDGTAPYIGGAKANVFVFFRLDQENSVLALRQLQEAKQRLGERSVHWALIVADSYPLESIKDFVKELGTDMTVLLDHDNELYGRLGVILHPVIGVADAEHVLQAYVPFRKLNLEVRVEAHVKRVLGEINDEQLEAILNPPPIKLGGNGTVAKRNLRMGQMFLKMKKYDAALQAAAKSMDLDPELAGPYGLKAAAYAEQGDCSQALPALRRALELDAEEPLAKAAAERCSPGTE
ncbi:MAG: hypothetical protein AMJ69_12470 [Gammaproteobacteria bacterium SG8_47]|nr:MAG: hypothetical protein AMJ69_12470 [Gammaproteobacteria bacterium SG8_47]